MFVRSISRIEETVSCWPMATSRSLDGQAAHGTGSSSHRPALARLRHEGACRLLADGVDIRIVKLMLVTRCKEALAPLDVNGRPVIRPGGRGGAQPRSPFARMSRDHQRSGRHRAEAAVARRYILEPRQHRPRRELPIGDRDPSSSLGIGYSFKASARSRLRGGRQGRRCVARAGRAPMHHPRIDPPVFEGRRQLGDQA